MDSAGNVRGNREDQQFIEGSPPEFRSLVRGGPSRDIRVGVPGDLRVAVGGVDVEFQPLGKRSLQIHEDAWRDVADCIAELGINLDELGSRDAQAGALLDAIEAVFAEEGIDAEYATLMLSALSSLTRAIQVVEGEDSEAQRHNLSRTTALLGDVVRDFGDSMDSAKVGLVLQAASNVYMSDSADADACQQAAELLSLIVDRCVLDEASNQREIILKMLESPPSRFKKEPEFLEAHANAISTASAAIDGLTGVEAVQLLKGVQTILKRTADESVREACLNALENLESFVEDLPAEVIQDVQDLREEVERLLDR